MTAPSALLPDIPRVQKDASIHPYSFFSFIPRSGHSLPKVARETSFSILRHNAVGSLGLVTALGSLGSSPGLPAPPGLLVPPRRCSPDPLDLSELLCSSKKRKGGRGIALEGCF